MDDAKNQDTRQASRDSSNPGALHRVLFEEASEGMFIADPHGRYVAVNLRLSELTGYSFEEILDISIADLIPPEDIDPDPFPLGDLRQGKIIVKERCIRRKDGSLLQMEVSARMLPEGSLLGIVRDITERNRAEEALRESEEKYRRLIETTDTGYVIIDEQGRVIDANQEYVRLTGRRPEDVIGHSVLEWTAPRDWERNAQEVRKCIEQGCVRNLEIDYITPTGQFIPVDINATVLRTSGTFRIMSLCRDITERKHVEAALRDSEERYKALFDRSLDCVFLTDFEGHFLDANQAALDLLGYQRQDISTLMFASLLTADQLPLAFQTIEEIRATGFQKSPTEYRLRRADGEFVFVETQSSLIYREREPFAIQGIARDITERKIAEETLRRTQFSVDRAREAIFLVTFDAGLAYVNDAACRSLGYTREELLSMTVFDFDPEFPRDQWEEIWVSHSGVESYLFETVHKTRDGRIFPVEITANPIVFGGKEYRVTYAHDITERKQAESALRESERKYRELVENANSIILRWDREGRITFLNEFGLHFFGFSSEEIIGHHVVGMIVPMNETSGRDMRPLMDQICAHPREFERNTNENMRKSGERVWIDWTNKTVLDAEGQIVEILSVGSDITERRKLEERLTRLNECLLSFGTNPIENINKLVRLCGEQLAATCALYNRLDEGMLCSLGQWNTPPGFLAKDAPEGHICYDVIRDPLLEVKVIRDIHETSYAKTDPNILLYGLKTYVGKVVSFGSEPVGSICVVYQSDQNFTDKDKEFMEIVASAIGVEEMRREAEKSVIESEQRFKTLVEASFEGIALSDSGIFVDVSDQLARMLGYERRELIGKPVVHVVSPEYRATVGYSIKNGLTEPLEHLMLRKDGTVFPAEIRPKMMQVEGRELRMAAIRDITERKRAEEEKAKLESQLLQAQKMEAVGQLAGGIAHDFNNILTAIIGYGSLLQAKMNDNALLREYIKQILDSADRATEVTRSLLAFSRKQMMNPRPVDLNDIVRRIDKLLSRLIGADIEMNTVLAKGKIICMVDPGQMEQVLMNLTANARDSMPNGGRLTLTTEVVELDDSLIQSIGLGEPGKYALLSVSDTGIGIKQEDMEKIFEPFFTTKETGKGTGLGLAMVYGIIKQHGGYIKVYSEPDKGTIFRIYLQATQTKEERLIKRPLKTQPARGTETVLVAEDDEKLRDLSEIVLAQNGYEVILAQDGKQAVDKFIENKDRIQLVIIDMIMPKKSGKETYEEIKAVKPDIKVLFSSGYTSDRMESLFRNKEELHFINKPISPKDLLRKVREILDK